MLFQMLVYGALGGCTLLVICRQHGWGFYQNILSLQITIWSIHLVPPVIVFCATEGNEDWSALVLVWALCSWLCRQCEWSVYSLVFLCLEVVCGSVNFGRTFLVAILILQPLVIIGFWGAIFLASCFEDFSFLEVDRHIRLGILHTCRDSNARNLVARECYGHLLMQTLAAAALVIGPFKGRLPLASEICAAIPSLLLLLTVYAVVTLGIAFLFPPHELPYELGHLPSWLTSTRKPSEKDVGARSDLELEDGLAGPSIGA